MGNLMRYKLGKLADRNCLITMGGNCVAEAVNITVNLGLTSKKRVRRAVSKIGMSTSGSKLNGIDPSDESIKKI